MSRSWHSQGNKKLHQARINPELEQSIRTVEIIRDTSISAITKQAIQMYTNKYKEMIRDYHLTLAAEIMMDQHLIEIGRQVYLTGNDTIALTESNIHLRKFTTEQVKTMIVRNL